MISGYAQLSSLYRSGVPIRTGILLFPGVEVLDFAGPYEVFSVATRMVRQTTGPDAPGFELHLVAASDGIVHARHGLPIAAGHSLSDAPDFDLLVVPGGMMTQPLGDRGTLDYLARATGRAHVTASVCTGAFLLAKLGLLAGKAATTHWEDIPELRAAYPDIEVLEDVPFVELEDDGMITSAGISAGIGMSLHIVGRIMGHRLAHATARQMQYDWQEEARP